MLKRLALAVIFAASCDGTTVVSSPGPVVGDPCLELDYQSANCAGNYDWSVGFYDTYHVWHRPRYIRHVYIPSVHVYVPPVRVYSPAVRTVTTTRRITVSPSRTTTTRVTVRRR